MIKPLIIGNWKMNLLASQACELAQSLVDSFLNFEAAEVVIAPPFPFLNQVGRVLEDSAINLAGQNFHFEKEGAFTGEVSLGMLKDVGCRYSLIGHSERRNLFGERDEYINRKIHQALNGDVYPVLCIGETLEERRSGNTFRTIETQLTNGLASLKGDKLSQMTIAYEPVWAIGTGVNATPEQVAEVHKWIKIFFKESLGVSEEIRVLYGGSVNADNCEQLLKEDTINGVLVGGASLNFKSFCAIINSVIESS